jgi:YHS domain-containing protein
MIRLAVFVLLIIVVYKLLRGLLKKISVSENSKVPRDQIAADLVQDPQCGAYILPAQGVSARVGGKTFHFCSQSCKDKFLLGQSEKNNGKIG